MRFRLPFRFAARLLGALALAALAAPAIPPPTLAQGDAPQPRLVALPDGTTRERGDAPASRAVAGALSPSQTCGAAAPALLSPAEGAISNDIENPRYTWASVAGVTEYVFQLARDGAFSQLLRADQQTARADQTQVTHTSFYDLRPTTTYYWRVASVCGDGQFGAFSAPISFQTGAGSGSAACTLPPPTLLAPDNGAQVDTLLPENSWKREPNTFEYSYQIATDAAFATARSTGMIGIDPERGANITTFPSNNLTPDTLYYWRVASVCAEIDKQGAYSAPFTFRSGPAGGAFLPAPALLAPTDGATTGSIRVTLLYEAVSAATGYQVQFYDTRQEAEANDWSSAFTRSGTSVTTIELPQITFFWRVKTRNAYGWGPLSGIRSFTTPAVNAAATVDPQAGGTLSTSPGYLTANFPPGAVSGPTRLAFRLLANPQQPLPNLRFANRAFTLEAFAGDQPVRQFNKPFTMTVTYDPSDLLVAGIADPAQLNLVFWNGSAWAPILPCAGCAVDVAGRKVTVVLDHLTEFALVAPGATANTQRVFLPLVAR